MPLANRILLPEHKAPERMEEKGYAVSGEMPDRLCAGFKKLAFLLGKVLLLLHQQIVTKKAQTGSDFIIFNMNFMTLPSF